MLLSHKILYSLKLCVWKKRILLKKENCLNRIENRWKKIQRWGKESLFSFPNSKSRQFYWILLIDIEKKLNINVDVLGTGEKKRNHFIKDWRWQLMLNNLRYFSCFSLCLAVICWFFMFLFLHTQALAKKIKWDFFLGRE